MSLNRLTLFSQVSVDDKRGLILEIFLKIELALCYVKHHVLRSLYRNVHDDSSVSEVGEEKAIPCVN